MFTYSDVTNPVYANAAGTAINVMVFFDHLKEVVQFTASRDDVEEHGREIFDLASAGEFGPVGDYVAPFIPPKQKVLNTDSLAQALVDAGKLTQQQVDAAKK